MAVRPILHYSHPALRRKAQKVEKITPQIRHLARDLRETLKDAVGVGLAAPQVGENWQMFVYQMDRAKGCILNPVIENPQGEQIDVEGCLSIPGLQGDVNRALSVVVTGMDEKGRPVRVNAEGYLARVLQHEIDHLHGILFLDKAVPETLHRIPLTPSAAKVEAQARQPAASFNA